MLRQGRVSNAQRRAVDSLLPLFGIPYRAAPFDFDAAFARSAPRFLEIGFGIRFWRINWKLGRSFYFYRRINFYRSRFFCK